MNLHALKQLENWVFPPRCVITGQRTEQFDIDSNEVATWSKPESVCPRCAEVSIDSKLCGACLSDPPAYLKSQIGFYLEDPLKDQIYRLKYSDDWSVCRWLAAIWAERLDGSNVEAIVPIPLHPKRRRTRGYNQSLLLAEQLSQMLNLPLIEQGLKRVSNTPSQTHLDKAARQKNLKNAFEVNSAMFEQINSVALIDDVMTTGSTMHFAAAQLLKHSQVKAVEAWAVAKTK